MQMSEYVVELKNATKRFPGVVALRNMQLAVKPGEILGLIGENGAGKTTIVNLLMRFYDVDSGSILLSGRDIADYSRASTRDRFGMVLQDTWLFGGTIAENVAFGKPDATREEIIRACDEAYCDHFIRTLPQGYDTVIGSDTSSISSGQKQLLTIARALLAQRELLILDEATSNVDTRTELLIQKAMDRLMRGRTCFIIAHRLSTIVDADLILVLRDGRIVEQGTAEEIFAHPAHPYTIGLMASKPVVGRQVEKLYSIPGKVPNPINMPNYCYFKDRCEMCVNGCEGDYPCEVSISPTHKVSCYRYYDGKRPDLEEVVEEELAEGKENGKEGE